MSNLSGVKIAICKPDHGIVGGFERVTSEITRWLESQGAQIDTVTVDAYRLRQRLTGSGATELEVHRQLVDEFAALDLTGHDLVISTQPPSYAVRHERHLSIFYHHLRMYYDLSEVYVRSFGVDPEAHLREVETIRAIDQPLLESVTHVLAGSAEIAERLRSFNGLVDNVDLFTAGPSIATRHGSTPPPLGGHVACVSRMEWPKRTELAVGAVALTDEHATFVGEGGRRWFNEELAALTSLGAIDARQLDDNDLWLHPGVGSTAEKPPPRFRFCGHVDDATLDDVYAEAFCVVAPAFREDYGLTAIETMMRGRPLIVCTDGGGLTEFIEDGETGLVVDPTTEAIAAAIAKLRADPATARRIGQQAYEASAAFSWQQAHEQLGAAIDAILTP